MEITVSAGFKIIIVINVAIMDITELMICGILWLKSLSQCIHVIGIDRHDIPMCMGVKIFDRQRLHPAEQIIS